MVSSINKKAQLAEGSSPRQEDGNNRIINPSIGKGDLEQRHNNYCWQQQSSSLQRRGIGQQRVIII